MKKNKILILALLVCLSIPVGAQNTDSNITGIVVDKWGNPVYGASVNVAGIPDVRVETDKDGKFEIAADAGRSLQVVTTDKGSTTVKVEHGKAMKIVMDYAAQTIDVGANRTFTRQESTAAVSTVYNEDFNKRAAKNMSNSLYGQGLGLTTLQNAGNYASVEPTFYVRGLQSLSSSSPLVLVDGLERDMSLVTPEEVESVSVLKDAAETGPETFDPVFEDDLGDELRDDSDDTGGSGEKLELSLAEIEKPTPVPQTGEKRKRYKMVARRTRTPRTRTPSRLKTGQTEETTKTPAQPQFTPRPTRKLSCRSRKSS